MIPLFKVRMEPSVDQAVSKVLHSGFIGQGENVEEFEKALIPWIGRETILTVNSCTSAIQLALRLSGVQASDEVISTPVTCTATNEPIVAMGARIVWADVDPWTGNIDPQSVKKKITKKTKAVIAVHWGGLPCNIDALLKICKDHGIKLIEDAAHALGATYKGNPIGSHGDFVCFSFQAIKHLTTGDGGLLSCKSKKDYERAKLLRWYGIKRPANLKKDIPEWGYKFHMNDIAAAIGLENLKGLKEDLQKRHANADFINWFCLDPKESAYWFLARHIERRDAFIKHMAKNGIACGTVHERNDAYSMFRDFRTYLPGVDSFCKTQVNLPIGPWLIFSDRVRIVEAVHAFK